jgi:hypothetical protein
MRLWVDAVRTEPIHDWHSDGSECLCVAISVGPHRWTRGHQSGLWFESPGGAYTGTDRGVPLLLDRIEELEAELERTRQAWVDGESPDCEEVCMVACKGPCGVNAEATGCEEVRVNALKGPCGAPNATIIGPKDTP